MLVVFNNHKAKLRNTAHDSSDTIQLEHLNFQHQTASGQLITNHSFVKGRFTSCSQINNLMSYNIDVTQQEVVLVMDIKLNLVLLKFMQM